MQEHVFDVQSGVGEQRDVKIMQKALKNEQSLVWIHGIAPPSLLHSRAAASTHQALPTTLLYLHETKS